MCGDKLSAWSPRKEEVPVLLAVFLFFTGDLMMLYTAFPYTTYAVCIETFPNATASQCLTLHTRPEQEEVVTGTAALLFMAEKMVGPIPSLILAAILAPWSDLHGRRMPLLITCLGACLATVLFLLADWLRHISVVAIVMTGFVVRALTGQGFIFRLMAYSYTTDWINRHIQNQEKMGQTRTKAVEESIDYEEVSVGSDGSGRVRCQTNACHHPRKNKTKKINTRPLMPTPPSAQLHGGLCEHQRLKSCKESVVTHATMSCPNSGSFNSITSSTRMSGGRGGATWTETNLTPENEENRPLICKSDVRTSYNAVLNSETGEDNKLQLTMNSYNSYGHDDKEHMAQDNSDNPVVSVTAVKHNRNFTRKTNVLPPKEYQKTGIFSGVKRVDDTEAIKEKLLMRSMSRLQAAESLAVLSGTVAAWGIQVLASAPVSLCVSSAIHLMTALVILLMMHDVSPWENVVGNVTENCEHSVRDVIPKRSETDKKVTNDIVEISTSVICDVSAVSDDLVRKCPDPGRLVTYVTETSSDASTVFSDIEHENSNLACQQVPHSLTESSTAVTVSSDVAQSSHSVTEKSSSVVAAAPPVPNCCNAKEDTTNCSPSYTTTTLRCPSEGLLLLDADQYSDSRRKEILRLKNKVLKFFNGKLQGVMGNRVTVERKYMWGSFLTTLVLMGCVQGRAAVVMAFVQRAPLSWPNEYLSAFAGVCSAATSFFLFFLAPCLRDTVVVVVGLVCSVGGTVWMMFPASTFQMMAAGSFSQMADCVLPALKAILSKKVDKEHVGKVLSRLTAAEAFACMIGPLTLVTVYYATVQTFPGAAFLTSAVLTALVLIIGFAVDFHDMGKNSDRRAVACVIRARLRVPSVYQDN